MSFYRRDLPEPLLCCSPPSFLGAGALGGGLVLCGGGVLERDGWPEEPSLFREELPR